VLKMRKEQMTAFRAAALADFEERVLAHVARSLPARYATLGEGGVRAVIARGIERAATYRIVSERDVCKFIDLMLVLGDGFDRELAWARDALASSGEDPVAAANELYARASNVA
jgi:hypothetical protein